MRRRDFLALLGITAGAGCSGIDDGSPGTTAPSTTIPPSTNQSTTDEPSGDGPFEPTKRWSQVTFDTLPVTVSYLPTRLRVADEGELTLAFATAATERSPAILKGTLTNSNAFANTFRLRELPLFGDVPSAWPDGQFATDEYTYRDELVLAPTSAHDLATVVPELARGTDGRWRLTGEVDGPWFPETYRMAPGETVEVAYALVGRQGGSGFPAGRYHFSGHGDSEAVIAVWDTNNPGPTTESRFGSANPAPLPDADRMAWYHAADTDTAMYLSPSTERVELPAKVTYTFVNHGTQRASGNPYFWRLWKRVDGQWFHVAPFGWPVPLTHVLPGEVERWTLAAFPDQAIECDGLTVGYLGGGRYAFEVGINTGRETHAALLEMDAPPVQLEPTDGLAVTRDGDQVHVEWSRRTDEVPRATLTLTRTDTAETRLITEQVMRRRNAALRNTLAFFDDDVTQVRLVANRNIVSRGARTEGYESGRFRFRYRGTAYEAAATFDGSE